LSLNNGDRLKGITGKFAKYNTGSNGSAYLPELTSIDTATFEATAGDAVAPEVLTIAEVTDAKAAAYIQIKDATIVPDATATGSSAAKYFTITDNSGSASLYNSSSLAAISAATADAPVKGAVTGLVTVYSGALQITPLAIEVADESGVEAINGASDVAIVGIVGAISVVGYEGTVEVYNTLGQLVSATPVAGNALIPARAGLVIVKAGKTVAKVIVK
jgi:hypothetical protein